MIKSHPLTLTMKARPNRQRNICLFVGPFPLPLLSWFFLDALRWHQNRLKHSSPKKGAFSSTSCNLNGFERFSLDACSSWNLAAGFLFFFFAARRIPGEYQKKKKNITFCFSASRYSLLVKWHSLLWHYGCFSLSHSYIRCRHLHKAHCYVFSVFFRGRKSKRPLPDIWIPADFNNLGRLKVERG